MRTKILLMGVFVVIISSCIFPRYLPSSDNIDVNQYGSYIEIITKGTDPNIDGELIAIDSNKIIVLTEEPTRKCSTVLTKDIQVFKLRYAKPKNYGWTIPVFTLATIGHGHFFIFTAPVNLIVTFLVATSVERAFTYSDKNMTYDKLKMFARFPQGIPTKIDIASIK